MNVKRHRFIVEFHDGDWLLMLPSGDVRAYETPDAAFAAIRRYDAKRNVEMTISTIEWRNTPAGFVQPKA